MVGHRPFPPRADSPLARKPKLITKNMFYEVYVLKSQKDGIRYIGSGVDARERLRKHNKGDCRFTKGHSPWEIIYKEKYKTRSEAVRRERFLKSGQGRKWLDEQEIR